MPKTPIRKQSPQDRIKNFFEVALGYSEEEAEKEAKRCIQCKEPKCIEGCPVEIDIPAFIKYIKEGDFKAANDKLKEKNALPAICGRVCPQETQCEIKCVLSKKSEPVAIGRLERFAADWALNKRKSVRHKTSADARRSSVAGAKQKKVAIIGSGPAGLTCAAELAKKGYVVTIFESLHKAGGVLRYGIPEFRLPKKILDQEIDYIKKLGVDTKVNYVIGKTLTIEDLRKQGFKAFFIGTGAGLPFFLGIEGENLNGVYSANEFLTRANLMKAYDKNYDTPILVGKKVAVIGAGNVSMDSARVAKRLGAEEVVIVYRRSKAEMPARAEEIENAKEEGIKLQLLTNPIRIIGNKKGWVKAMECIKNRLGEPDESGRRSPVPMPGSEFTEEFDTVVCAIGQGPNPLLLKSIPGLELTKRGNIKADQDGKTSIPGIFAGGDIVTGAATVIEAMGAGKRAARAIDNYLSKTSLRGATRRSNL